MKLIGNKLIVKLNKTGEQVLPSGLITISNERKYTGTVVNVNESSRFKIGDSVEIKNYAYDKCIDEDENLFVIYERDIVKCNGEFIGDYVIAKLDYDRWKYKSVSGLLIERRTEINYITNNNEFGKHKSETICTFATIIELADNAKNKGFSIGDNIVYEYGYGLSTFKYDNSDCVKVPYDKILCKYNGNEIQPQGEWNFAVTLKEKKSELAVEETELKKQYEIIYSSENSSITYADLRTCNNGCLKCSAINRGDKVIADEMYKIDLPDDKTYSLIHNEDIIAIIK